MRLPVEKVPVLGTSLAYVQSPTRFMRHHYDEHGPVSETSMGPAKWTVLLGPDACGTALRNPEKAFASGPGWGFLVGPFFNRGLMLLDFGEHHQHRRILQEAFTRAKLEGYVADLGPAVARGMDQWRAGSEFQAYPALKNLTLDLANQVFMGLPPSVDQARMDRLNEAFVACVQAGGALVRVNAPGTTWRRAYRGRAVLEEFLYGELPARRAGGDGADLFSTLCHLEDEDGARFTDADIVNHMIFLLMAAHDTSTITVTTMMRHLGQHPQWQQRLRDEAAALPEHPTFEQLTSLTGFDLVMKESLRLTPPVPVVARKTVKDTEVLGHHIPADRLVTVMVNLQHQMAELWPDPQRFDPERFSDDRREDKVHRDAWMPFGAGVHKCLGMAFSQLEVFTILHQLLRRFEWTVPTGYRPPMNNHSLPFPKDGLPVDLRSLRRAAV